jgi:hypothetical protein
MSNNIYKNALVENTDTIETPTREDYNFYRKRVLHMIKDMFKGKYPNEHLKQIHMDYTNVLIEHLKMQDITDIIQKEHQESPNKTDIKPPLQPFDLSDTNKCMYQDNVPKTVTLDNFVTSTSSTELKASHLPSKRIVNIKTEEHKTKGIPTEKVNLLKSDQNICV